MTGVTSSNCRPFLLLVIGVHCNFGTSERAIVVIFLAELNEVTTTLEIDVDAVFRGLKEVDCDSFRFTGVASISFSSLNRSFGTEE